MKVTICLFVMLLCVSAVAADGNVGIGTSNFEGGYNALYACLTVDDLTIYHERERDFQHDETIVQYQLQGWSPVLRCDDGAFRIGAMVPVGNLGVARMLVGSDMDRFDFFTRKLALTEVGSCQVSLSGQIRLQEHQDGSYWLKLHLGCGKFGAWYGLDPTGGPWSAGIDWSVVSW